MIASVSSAGRLNRVGRSGCRARCTAQAVSGRVTSCSSEPCRWSIRPRPRSWLASASAAAATAADVRPMMLPTSASVTGRFREKHTASSAVARSSGSASATPSGTTARPNTSMASSTVSSSSGRPASATSSTGADRDGPEGLALVDDRLAEAEQLEEGEETRHRLEPGGHCGEKVLEGEPAAAKALAQLAHLLLDGEGGGGTQGLLVVQPGKDVTESSGKPFGRDAQSLDRDDVGRDQAEEAARPLLRRLGQEGFGGSLEEPVLVEAAAGVVDVAGVVARLGGNGVQRVEAGGLEGHEPRRQGEEVGHLPEVGLLTGGVRARPVGAGDLRQRDRVDVHLAALHTHDQLLEASTEARDVDREAHGDVVQPVRGCRGGPEQKFLGHLGAIVRIAGRATHQRPAARGLRARPGARGADVFTASPRNSTARATAASVTRPDMSRAISSRRLSPWVGSMRATLPAGVSCLRTTR